MTSSIAAGNIILLLKYYFPHKVALKHEPNINDGSLFAFPAAMYMCQHIM